MYPKKLSKRRLQRGTRSQKRSKYNHSKKLEDNINSSVVTNLSNFKLTKYQTAVLNKGLNFIPHDSAVSYKQLDADIKRFERKLQLYQFFRDKNEEDDENDDPENVRLAFEENPNYWPHKLNKNITELCRELKEELHKLHNQPTHFQNLNKYERNALKQLQSNRDIIIKKADKNSGIVVMNKETYENKVYEMLRDTNTYKPLETEDNEIVKNKVNNLLMKLMQEDYITEKQYRNLTAYKVKTPIFYGIPKIHKNNNPLRPIVSQIDGPTYRMNKYIHELLYVAELEIPFLFKDTTAFLQVIESHKIALENCYLVTMDVVSLYTNIPHAEAINYICEHYTDTLKHWHRYKTRVFPVKTKHLKELLELMLTNCTLEFNNEFFSQLYGTPMGAPASVRIANIFMFKLLNKFLSTYVRYKPEFIGRLIDDLFLIWHNDENELMNFYNALNTFHTTIKFEITYSKEKVNFLDTTIYIQDGFLKTTLYTKPTDKKQYLSYFSSHPKHVMKAIPYSQALRYRRIISEDDILTVELNKLLEKFTKRGYPIEETKKLILKVCDLPRVDTLTYKSEEQKKEEFKKFTKGGAFLPLIITYRPEYIYNSFNLHKILNTLWQTYIDKDEEFKTTFTNSEPKIVFKKGRNLGNILIRAKYGSLEKIESSTEDLIQCLAELAAENMIEHQIQKCNNKRCKLCAILLTEPFFSSSVTKETFTINEDMNCASKNCIYLVTCTICNVQYIGESSRPLRERFNNHRSDIKLRKETAIAKHFTEILHEYKHLRVTPIEIVSDHIERKDRESYWINKLKSKYPLGLNSYPL